MASKRVTADESSDRRSEFEWRCMRAYENVFVLALAILATLVVAGTAAYALSSLLRNAAHSLTP
jgi:hypothetical protein